MTSSTDTIDRFRLDGRVCIVTGALGLLGREHCRALAGAGARVVVADLDESACRDFAASLADELKLDADAAPVALGFDVTAPDEVDDALERCLDATMTVHALVNNAAVNDTVENPDANAELSRFENYPLELWRRSIEVNVTGTFLCSQRFGKVMADQGRGSIVNIGSTYGVSGPDQSLYERPDGSQTFYKTPAYPTTKGAVIQFTRYLAAYWGRSGVRVNTLTPGGVENAQPVHFQSEYGKRTPLGRMANRSELGGALIWLCSDASSYVTGANICVDGGWTAW